MDGIKGIRLCGGTAAGPVFIYKKNDGVNAEKVKADPEAEEKRLLEALEKVKADFISAGESIRKSSGEKDAAMFEARLMMLTDEEWLSSVKECLRREEANAEYCVLKVGKETADKFKAQEDEYMRARSEDAENIAKAVAMALCGDAAVREPETPSIIVSEEFSPEDVAFFKRELVLGLVSKKGSPVSHTAILAGNLGIPFLSGIDVNGIGLKDGMPAVIDAAGELFIPEPAEECFKKYEKLAAEERRAQELAAKNAAEDLKNCPIKLYANIGKASDVAPAIENGAAGIGLFRTEFLYMDREDVPDEEEQFLVYKQVLTEMGDKPVIIRTIDIGADKQTKCVPLPREENPALGTRGIRISFANPELFRTQIRALLRAAVFGNLKIMYPMITSLEEVDDIFAFVNETAGELEKEGTSYRLPPQGIMIETPAAALISDVLAKKVAFFSVGTNDLTQYTIALDRTGDSLLRYYKPHHEAMLRLIAMSAENAHKAGIEIGICGELGSDPEVVSRFVDMGIDELSMSAPKIRKTAGIISRYVSEKKKSTGTVSAPVDGTLYEMKDIPDPAFSSGSMGECIGIMPDNGDVYAPCSGTVTGVAVTRHAFSLRAEDGEELLIHIGIDTVNLQGKYFNCGLTEGQKVTRGEKLMDFDPLGIRQAGYCPMVIVIKMGRQD